MLLLKNLFARRFFLCEKVLQKFREAMFELIQTNKNGGAVNEK